VSRAVVVTTLLSATVWPAAAGAVRTWEASFEELARGRAEGVAVTRRARLFPAPRLAPVGGARGLLGPALVRALATDGAGNLYVGTGPGGQVLRIGASGETVTHFRVDEPLVTALAVEGAGDLLVATAPGGTVYRVRPDGTGERWAETEERYVWSLAVGSSGIVYAGTGERGRILTLDASGNATVLFDSDESHVVSLFPLSDGGLLAGGAGRGVVYRLDAEGHALALHDDDLSEVAALAVDQGAVVAALLAPAPAAVRRPALRLRLPDGVQVGATGEALGTLEEDTGPTLHGTIEGLAAPGAVPGERPAGRIVRIGARGAVEELWSSTTEAPFGLALDARGRILFGTGEPARLYRVEPDGDVALLATLREAQVTALRAEGRRVVVATSHPAAVYRLEEGRAEAATYHSATFDAGGPARWGAFRWSVEGSSVRPEVYTRTGNSQTPDDTWSAWSPAMTDPAESVVANPDGRFLQWRLRQVAGFDPEARFGRFRVRYEPYNRPPSIDRFREITPAEMPPGIRTFGWTVADPDGDALDVRLEYRAVGVAAWETGAVTPVPAARDGSRAPLEGRLEWDVSGLAEGEYEVRGITSDLPANPPEDAREAAAWPETRLVVDRSPPSLEVHRVDGRRVRVRVEDTLSDIARLEVVEGPRTRFTPRPEDGVCDSSSETFRFEVPDGGEVSWRVRGTDAAGNVSERPLPPPEPSP
jgi:hypothetical protein